MLWNSKDQRIPLSGLRCGCIDFFERITLRDNPRLVS